VEFCPNAVFMAHCVAPKIFPSKDPITGNVKLTKKKVRWLIKKKEEGESSEDHSTKSEPCMDRAQEHRDNT